MASRREYLDFVLEQLADLDGIAYRPMIGEYVLYCDGRVVGGIYDDRLLLKATPGALRLMPDAESDIPYPGAKPMLVADVDNREGLCRLVAAIAAELPESKKRTKR